MERRAFLKFILAGAGAAAVAEPARALTSIAPLAAPDAGPAAESAVATAEDIENAKVEKTQWYYRRRVWRPRRWRRRYWRYYRRFYRPRRRYYYY